jgi:hypothetical protein
MERRRNTIVLVSPDTRLGMRRKRLLEPEGLPVVVIQRPDELVPACKKHRPRLIMIGKSADPAQRRQVWAAARAACESPIVELTHNDIPEPAQINFFVAPEPPSEFVRRVKQILKVRR